MQRRSFLELAILSVPASTLVAQVVDASLSSPGVVPAGHDREEKKHAVGVSSTAYKVLTRETGGALFVLEQTNQKKGGPNLHLHYGEDELFYAIEGEYLVQVGEQLFRLKAGDCVLGPKKVSHAWAFVGDSAGRLLLTYAPAGKMEAFFNERERLGIKPGAYASTAKDGELLRAFGMELLGPPLKIG